MLYHHFTLFLARLLRFSPGLCCLVLSANLAEADGSTIDSSNRLLDLEAGNYQRPAVVQTVFTSGDSIDPMTSNVQRNQVGSLADLLSVNTGDLQDRDLWTVNQYFADQPGGGGIYRWSASTPKAEHDGRVIVDPDVVWSGAQADIAQLAEHINPQRTGSGCWVLEEEFTRAGSERRQAFFDTMKGKFILIAHRGRELDVAPENTIGALATLPPGVRAVETDVRFTSDGVAVAFHDATLDDRTNGTGRLSDITFDELQQLDAGSWLGPEWEGERVPKILDYLLECKRLGIEYVLLDAKELSTLEQAQVYIDIIREADMLDRAIIMVTGNQAPTSAQLVRTLDDEVLIGSFRLTPDNKDYWIPSGRLFNYCLIKSRPNNRGFDNGWPLYPEVMANGIIPGTSTLNSTRRMEFAAAETDAAFSLTDHVSRFAHLERGGNIDVPVASRQ